MKLMLNKLGQALGKLPLFGQRTSKHGGDPAMDSDSDSDSDDLQSNRPIGQLVHRLNEQGEAALMLCEFAALTGKGVSTVLAYPPGGKWRLTCEVIGAENAKAKSAFFVVEGIDDTGQDLQVAGFTPFRNGGKGLYRYLNVRQGPAKTTFDFELPQGVRSIRLAALSWFPEQDLKIRNLAIRRATPIQATVNITVDVEALPARTDADHVERLIHGRFGDGASYGISRLCDIFERHGARASFFVEYAACAQYGERPIFEASEYLLRRGHDVQLHLHPDIWLRKVGRMSPNPPTPGFEAFPFEVARDSLLYGMEMYKKHLGVKPRIFRPGGMRHSLPMYQAAREVGIEAVSAIYQNALKAFWPRCADYPVFRWSNGIIELPLDFGMDPLENHPGFQEELQAAALQRLPYPHVSFLLHSTSLLKYYKEVGYYRHYHAPFEAQLESWFEKNSASSFVTCVDTLDRFTSKFHIPELELTELYEK